jgi:predicted dehydrogenase
MNVSRRTFLTAAAAATAAAGIARAEEKTYRAVVIGDTKNGGYGHDLHMVFAHRPDVSIAALADPDEAGRAARAAECGAPVTYADYREMLEKEKPDIAIIAPRWTPPHKDYLLACAEAGCHGFMEKPLCVDLEEADAMVAAVESRGLKWALAHNFRMTPMVAHVKKVVDEGLIGTVVEARARGKEDDRAGGEDLVVLGCHLFDMMAYFLGDPQWCMSDVTHNGQPATPADVREATEPLGPIVGNRIHAMYGFGEGVAGHFSSMRTKEGNGARWALNLYGTKGCITINLNRVAPVIKYLDDSIWHAGARGSAWADVPGMPAYVIDDPKTQTYIPNITDLMDAIANNREPACSLAHGRRAQEMIQGVWASHVAGCRVALPLAERKHPLKGWGA